jgi:HEAT repeat protein
MRAVITLAAAIAAAGLGGVASGQEVKADMELSGIKPGVVFHGKTLVVWSADLKSKDPSVKERALAAIKMYGNYAQTELNRIIDAIDDHDAGIRANAIITLGFVGLDAEHLQRGMSAVIRRLDSSEQEIVKFQVLQTLPRLAGQQINASAATSRVVALLKYSRATEVRQAAANALAFVAWLPPQQPNPNWQFDRSAWEALLGLQGPGGLNDSSAEVRLQCLSSLIRFGVPNRLADGQIEQTQLANHFGAKEPEKIRIWARVALMRITSVSEKHLGEIAKFLDSPKLEARVNAAQAFAFIGTAAKTKVPELNKALDDKEPEVIVWSCNALSLMGTAAQPALPKLKQLMQDRNEAVKKAAEEAIHRISEPGKEPEEKPKRGNR